MAEEELVETRSQKIKKLKEKGRVMTELSAVILPFSGMGIETLYPYFFPLEDMTRGREGTV